MSGSDTNSSSNDEDPSDKENRIEGTAELTQRALPNLSDYKGSCNYKVTPPKTKQSPQSEAIVSIPVQFQPQNFPQTCYEAPLTTINIPMQTSHTSSVSRTKEIQMTHFNVAEYPYSPTRREGPLSLTNTPVHSQHLLNLPRLNKRNLSGAGEPTNLQQRNLIDGFGSLKLLKYNNMIVPPQYSSHLPIAEQRPRSLVNTTIVSRQSQTASKQRKRPLSSLSMPRLLERCPISQTLDGRPALAVSLPQHCQRPSIRITGHVGLLSQSNIQVNSPHTSLCVKNAKILPLVPNIAMHPQRQLNSPVAKVVQSHGQCNSLQLKADQSQQHGNCLRSKVEQPHHLPNSPKQSDRPFSARGSLLEMHKLLSVPKLSKRSMSLPNLSRQSQLSSIPSKQNRSLSAENLSFEHQQTLFQISCFERLLPENNIQINSMDPSLYKRQRVESPSDFLTKTKTYGQHNSQIPNGTPLTVVRRAVQPQSPILKIPRRGQRPWPFFRFSMPSQRSVILSERNRSLPSSTTITSNRHQRLSHITTYERLLSQRNFLRNPSQTYICIGEKEILRSSDLSCASLVKKCKCERYLLGAHTKGMSRANISPHPYHVDVHQGQNRPLSSFVMPAQLRRLINPPIADERQLSVASIPERIQQRPTLATRKPPSPSSTPEFSENLLNTSELNETTSLSAEEITVHRQSFTSRTQSRTLSSPNIRMYSQNSVNPSRSNVMQFSDGRIQEKMLQPSLFEIKSQRPLPPTTVESSERFFGLSRQNLRALLTANTSTESHQSFTEQTHLRGYLSSSSMPNPISLNNPPRSNEMQISTPSLLVRTQQSLNLPEQHGIPLISLSLSGPSQGFLNPSRLNERPLPSSSIPAGPLQSLTASFCNHLPLTQNEGSMLSTNMPLYSERRNSPPRSNEIQMSAVNLPIMTQQPFTSPTQKRVPLSSSNIPSQRFRNPPVEIERLSAVVIPKEPQKQSGRISESKKTDASSIREFHLSNSFRPSVPRRNVKMTPYQSLPISTRLNERPLSAINSSVQFRQQPIPESNAERLPLANVSTQSQNIGISVFENGRPGPTNMIHSTNLSDRNSSFLSLLRSEPFRNEHQRLPSRESPSDQMVPVPEVEDILSAIYSKLLQNEDHVVPE